MTKKYSIRLLKFLPIIFLLWSIIFPYSCANTTTPPTGGDKDTLPPIITNIKPLPYSINVDTNSNVVFTFNEYIKIKAGNNIFLSPPLDKAPKYKIRGKQLVVSFESPLEKNRTYSLDITGAIADNNEANAFPGYNLIFSTGSKIDSMLITGTVLDCNSLQPVKDATVMIYKDLSDSAIFKHRPYAAVKTDEWGYFALRNIANTKYRLYAIMDKDNNNIYNPDNEKIAFCDSIIEPKLVAKDTLKELLKYDMKDSVNIMARKSEYELLMFKERANKQTIVKQVRVNERTAYLTFMARKPIIDSMWLAGYPPNVLITQFNPQKDSLEIWINSRQEAMDTLHLFIDYLKTDTNNVLKPYVEHLRLAEENRATYASRRRNKINHSDTIASFKLSANPITIEDQGFDIEFNYPIINEDFNKIQLIATSPRQEKIKIGYKVVRDSINLRKYYIQSKEDFKQGYEYLLKIPERIFRDINGFYNDSTETKVSLPKDDKLCQLSLNLSNVKHRYLVELLNDKRNQVIKSFSVNKAEKIVFKYLNAGNYTIRLTEDINNNGIVDSGNLLEKRQAEKVKFYRLANNSYILNLKEGIELEQDIDIADLFKD